MLTPNQELIVRYLLNKDALLSGENFFKYTQTRGITVSECKDVLGTTELRKLMSEFRRSGQYKVISVWEKGDNKFGKECRYKRYFLEPIYD